MPSRTFDYPVFDADNHLYETRDALTRYLPVSARDAIQYVEIDGRTKIVVRGQISDYIPNPTFDRVGRPGSLADYYRNGNPDGRTQRQIMGRGIDCPEAFRSAGARLGLMDEQGLDHALMLPTLASLIEERMTDVPDLAADVVHALNRWMEDEWPFQYMDRIFSVPVITPGLVNRAMSELDYLLRGGAKLFLMRPSPAWGHCGPRSFALPEFDPFWDLVEQSGMVVVIHASDTGYTRYVNEWEGTRTEKLAFGAPNPFTSALRSQHRDICDAVTSLVAHGACWRFPKLKFALIENGAGWLPGLVHHLELAHRQSPHAFDEPPLDTLRRNFHIHPFHEEDPHGVVELMGADNVIFGSDFPHVEGVADPVTYVDELAGLPQEDVEKIMGGNMLRLLDIDHAASV